VRSLPLAEHTAIEIGRWPGSLPARHAVHEAFGARPLLQGGAKVGAAVEVRVVAVVVVRRAAATLGHHRRLRTLTAAIDGYATCSTSSGTLAQVTCSE
jgi:hypothetical protein